MVSWSSLCLQLHVHSSCVLFWQVYIFLYIPPLLFFGIMPGNRFTTELYPSYVENTIKSKPHLIHFTCWTSKLSDTTHLRESVADPPGLLTGVLHCCCPHHEIVSYCLSLAQKKTIQIQNSKYGFYGMYISFISWSWKTLDHSC